MAAETQLPPTPVISSQTARPSITPTPTPTPGFLEQTNIARLTEWAGNNQTIEAMGKPPTYTPTSPGPTPTKFVDTYPHKHIWLSYDYFSGNHFLYESFIGGPINFPTLILYTDGQIILFHDNQPVWTKMLSPDEICSLFITLESMGLSKIQTTGTGHPDDPIYQSSTELGGVTDDGETILYFNGITPRQYIVTDYNKNYAVKAIRNIFDFLNQYEPRDLQPYHADRLYVYFSKGQDVYLQLFGDSHTVKPLSWPRDVTPLNRNDHGFMYLEGEAASKVFDLTGNYGFVQGVFIDQDIEYTVFILMLLPDELRGNDSYYRAPDPFTPSFSCKYVDFK